MGTPGRVGVPSAGFVARLAVPTMLEVLNALSNSGSNPVGLMDGVSDPRDRCVRLLPGVVGRPRIASELACGSHRYVRCHGPGAWYPPGRALACPSRQ